MIRLSELQEDLLADAANLSTNNNQGLMTEHQQVKQICELGQSTPLLRAL